MSDIIQFGLLGLGLGAIYALLGQGVLLIYRGSGVVNIAHGGFAMIGAYLYLQFSSPSSFNASVPVTAGLPPVLAFVLAVVVTALLGLAVDQLVLRRMRNASPLTRLIATLIVLLVLQAGAAKIWGYAPPFVKPILPSSLLKIGDASISESYFWLLGIGIVITAALMIVWRYTRIGWVTAAVSQNERGAAALGISPGFVSSATWVAGTALAAVAGILVAPITQVSPTALSLLIIPVLAALVLADFKSFPLVLAASLFMGVAQTILIRFNADFKNLTGIAAVSDAFPLIVLIVVLLARGSSLPLRGQAGERLPLIGNGRFRWGIVIPLFVVVMLLIFLVFPTTWLSALSVTFVVSIILLSLVVLIGYTGQVSIAQYAIAAVGGLIGARLTVDLGFTFIPALIVGTLAAAVIGLLFALPALRTRGVNLAVITLAATWAVNDMILTNSNFSGTSAGLRVGQASILGLDISGSTHPERYAAFTLIVLVIAMFVVTNLRRGRLGRSMIAVRSNERAASASGVNVSRTKMISFTISGALAGLGGILLTYQFTTASFTQYDTFTSMLAVAWIVIGGVGFVVGAIFAAVGAPSALSSLIALNWQGFVDWLPLIAGLGSLGAIIFNPHGIVQDLSVRFGKLEKRIAPKLPWVRPVKRFEPSTEAVTPTRVEPKNLTVTGLSVRYGGVVAVDSLSFEVRPGQVVGLIGPNGAGKTSLMDAVSGFTPYSGSVSLGDEKIDGWAPHRRAGHGIVRSFQGLELFPEMTVLENLQVPQDRKIGLKALLELVRPSKTVLDPVTMAAVQDFGLAPLLHKTPDDISYGERRLVAIARAVAAKPSVLLLDEPVAGLSDSESAEFGRLVRRLADSWGMAVLVIEHDMNFVMSICDRITVIDFGKHVCDGTAGEVRENPAAIAAYLGDDAEENDSEPTGATPVVAGKGAHR
ncbi:ABC transporter permease subunit [Herbiconiux daphne]|uniref:Branched-chain amino acid ABC transporter permease/ATP-binding protein n=1 Tax=Herbiconiux daphne TaxID=2970914 RepID=A0ABT2H3P4_9MICO|nr:branched-chain amino acid ABC transporter permease/ATP-binding protein [Herbiconiux daphne]MCS5734552.1 branched-chain amino acid ABC transporter permease/ATP-binding protein [Herbiconiux daphne]